jgi:threonine synthase
MKFISTKDVSVGMSFSEAALLGMAEDGGLFVPETIPELNEAELESIKEHSFQETARLILSKFIDEAEINLPALIKRAFNFPVKLKSLSDNLFVLELFHGPSNAFKDFGARFLAAALSEISKKKGSKLNILVATSGDTGSAVGKAFLNIENIEVFLLYPSGKISAIQEKQITTIGGNVTALEIEGTFDDCQTLVKKAFADDKLKEKINLSSANSINIARLLPQVLYYFEIHKKIADTENLLLSIPSGNLGNLTGALIAKRMGLPIQNIVSALNKNDVFNEYISTGCYKPRRAVPTLSNAMDVGAPNNLERINYLFGGDIESLRKTIHAASVSDEETREAISEIYNKFNYVVCPHTAVAYASFRKTESKFGGNVKRVFAATAHPAKFIGIYEEKIKNKIEMPKGLKEAMAKEKKTIILPNEYGKFRDYLLFKRKKRL